MYQVVLAQLVDAIADEAAARRMHDRVRVSCRSSVAAAGRDLEVAKLRSERGRRTAPAA
jgi:hypothetical protein